MYVCIYIYIYIYKSIPLHSCDYLKKISVKMNVANNEGNSGNEIEIAVKSWL